MIVSIDWLMVVGGGGGNGVIEGESRDIFKTVFGCKQQVGLIVSRDWLMMMDGSGGDELIEGAPTHEVRRYSQSGQG